MCVTIGVGSYFTEVKELTPIVFAEVKELTPIVF
jgi:hypothetical protein